MAVQDNKDGTDVSDESLSLHHEGYESSAPVTSSSPKSLISLRSHPWLLALFASHAIARWTNRMWEFAAPLLLLHAMSSGSSDPTLLLVALYGIAESLAISLCSVPAGRWLDKSDRLPAVTLAITAQNGSLIVSAVSILVLQAVSYSLGPSTNDSEYDSFMSALVYGTGKGFQIFLVFVVCLSGALAGVAGLVRGMAIERDWAVEIAQHIWRGSGRPLASTADAGNDEEDSLLRKVVQALPAIEIWEQVDDEEGMKERMVKEAGNSANEEDVEKGVVVQENSSRERALASSPGVYGSVHPGVTLTSAAASVSATADAASANGSPGSQHGGIPLHEAGSGSSHKSKFEDISLDESSAETAGQVHPSKVGDSPYYDGKGGQREGVLEGTTTAVSGGETETHEKMEQEGEEQGKVGKEAIVYSSEEAESERGRVQASLNASLRRIDLFCRLIAPMTAGILLAFLSNSLSPSPSLPSTSSFSSTYPLPPSVILGMIAWFAFACVAELLLLRIVTHTTPSLKEQRGSSKQMQTVELYTAVLEDMSEEEEEEVFAIHSSTFVTKAGKAAGKEDSASTTSAFALPFSDASNTHTTRVGAAQAETAEKGTTRLPAGKPVIGRAIEEGEAVLLDESSLMSDHGYLTAVSGSMFKWLPPSLRRHAGSAYLAVRDYVRAFLDSWQVYKSQPTLLPSLSLSLLYFTVLSFGSIMCAYLAAQSFPLQWLGVASACAALTGLAGTFVFPNLRARFGTGPCSLGAIAAQLVLLLPCGLAAAVLHGVSPVPAWLLVVSVILSRTWLWMFDLAVLQMTQDEVKEGDRGKVGGVQESLQQACQLGMLVLCAIISSVQSFWILVLLSCGAVTCATLLTAWYNRRYLMSLLRL